MEKVEDDPRFKLSVETRAKLTKRSFKEDLEITRSSLARLGYNLKKETKSNVTTESLEKESAIDEAPPEENIKIKPPKLECVNDVENLESEPSPPKKSST